MKQINQRHIIIYIFVVYLFVLVIAQFFVSSGSAYDVNLDSSLERPNLTHWLGTDDYGRDLFSRVIIGARYTLIISLITLLATVFIGVPLGLIAGYKKGVLDAFIMRMIDIGLSIPEFVLMIALASFLNQAFGILL